MYHDDLFPNADGQFVAVARVHVGNSVRVVGSPNDLGVLGQRDFPAFLPAAVGKQEGFTVAGQGIDFHPKTNCGGTRIELRTVRCVYLGGAAVERERTVSKAETVGGQGATGDIGVVAECGAVRAVATESVVGNFALYDRWRRVLGSVQCLDLWGRQCHVE